MKAMVLREFHQPFKQEDVPIPVIGDHDLLIKVKACGVCYTDVKIASGFIPDVTLPRILGHEVAGQVVRMGKEVRNFQEGDRVCLYFYLYCGRCPSCLAGEENLCLDLRGRIGFHVDGGYGEYLTGSKKTRSWGESSSTRKSRLPGVCFSGGTSCRISS